MNMSVSMLPGSLKKRITGFLFFIAVISVFSISDAKASTYVDLDDEAYYTLARLEAEGVIKTSLLSIKPLSRKEVFRLATEAEQNAEGRSREILDMIAALRARFHGEEDVFYLKAPDTVYGRYSYHDSNLQVTNYNNDGDAPAKGSNIRLGAITRLESKWISLYANPEFRYSDHLATVRSMERTYPDFAFSGQTVKVNPLKLYGLVSIYGLDLVGGKDSQWWGPGYHGSLLLSNNAEPFIMLKLTNPEPALLPWIFKYLGPIRFSAFITRLEKERTDIPEPLLWGMNIDFKPSPYVELGIQRTALYGGEGRSESFSTWWDSFTAAGENTDPNQPGDQRAGGYLKVTLPFSWQPFQLYLDMAGDDQNNHLPEKWGYVTGIYLPRVAGLQRLELRGELAMNHIDGWPNYWYNHWLYTQGYTYQGRIIGHHMGTDSRDIFIEASYLLPGNYGRVSLSYDREEHNLSSTTSFYGNMAEATPASLADLGRVEHSKTDEIRLKGIINLTERMQLRAFYSYSRLHNPGNLPLPSRALNVFEAELRYRF